MYQVAYAAEIMRTVPDFLYGSIGLLLHITQMDRHQLLVAGGDSGMKMLGHVWSFGFYCLEDQKSRR